MQPLRITAELIAGYATGDAWSPSIDGILAAVTMRQRLGDDYYSPQPSALSIVTGLPLAIARHGDLWWYQCSSPIVIGLAGRERRYFHRRFDDQHERHLPSGIRKVMTAAGPYKTTRLHDTHVICRALAWHVIGDMAEIAAMLDSVEQVGARRGAGFGRVRRWSVEPGGDPDLAAYHRPLPSGAARETGPEMPWGLVPPLRAAVTSCVMPEPRHA